MAEKQLLAVSNLNDSNSMSKTDDSSFMQHQSPSQQTLIFSVEKKILFGTLMEQIKPIFMGNINLKTVISQKYGKKTDGFWAFRTKMVPTENLLSKNFDMEGILLKLLLIGNLMESFRPMFTERDKKS